MIKTKKKAGTLCLSREQTVHGLPIWSFISSERHLWGDSWVKMDDAQRKACEIYLGNGHTESEFPQPLFQSFLPYSRNPIPFGWLVKRRNGDIDAYEGEMFYCPFITAPLHDQMVRLLPGDNLYAPKEWVEGVLRFVNEGFIELRSTTEVGVTLYTALRQGQPECDVRTDEVWALCPPQLRPALPRVPIPSLAIAA